MKNKGASIYYDFPCIPEGRYDKSKIDYVYCQISNNLNFQVIGKPQEYVLPIDYFFDTLYHLNSTGREIRTEKIINDLQNIKGIELVK